MMDWSACPAVERSADTLSGAWRFKNTRVPVKALFENLESGATVDQFLDWFPGVNREQVLAVLAFAEESLAVLEISRTSENSDSGPGALHRQ
jgi:uncharacterized protein (DUF433 family)